MEDYAKVNACCFITSATSAYLLILKRFPEEQLSSPCLGNYV